MNTTMATPRDIQEIVSKLTSEKAKAREEGMNVLSKWLEGERSTGFCSLIGRKTAELRADEVPHAETWPFLLNLLMNCVNMEITTSKRRPPKLLPGKLLRICVQRADAGKLPGKSLMLLSVVKLLFNHILDVLEKVAIYQCEYSIMLRHLLSVKDYCYQMRKRTYCSFVVLYINNIVIAMDGKCRSLPNIKEEVFRNVSTFHILLENPPGDFPTILREEVVKGFAEICSQIREEGKVSRKLLECINTYLLKDGPNLGIGAMTIHSSLQDFILRLWHTTHDMALKNLFILYAKLQLKLNKSSDEIYLVEQLLDVVDKELDQSIVAATVISRLDPTWEDKAIGTFDGLELGLMELAASVYYKACKRKASTSNGVKRLRRENPADVLRDRLVRGHFLWCGLFYFLIRSYGGKIDTSHIINWFEGISGCMERILAHSASVHCYDGFIWLLRGLDELLSPRVNFSNSLFNSSLTSDKVKVGWLLIWNSLMHGLLMFNNITQVADAAIILLGNMLSKGIIGLPVVPQDVWELPIFKNVPSSSALYFISCYFSRRGIENDHGYVCILRRNLLKAVLKLITFEDAFFLNESIAALLPAAISSLCAGSRPFSYEDFCGFQGTTDLCNKAEETFEYGGYETFDYSVENLAVIGTVKLSKGFEKDAYPGVRLPQEMRQLLISETEDHLFQNISAAFKEIEMLDLPKLLFTCSFMCNFIYCSNLSWLHTKMSFFSWMLQNTLKLLESAIFFIERKHNEVKDGGIFGIGPLFDATGSVLSSLRSLICSPLFCHSRLGIGIDDEFPLGKYMERLLFSFVALLKDCSLFESNMPLLCNMHRSFSNDDLNVKMVDIELDVDDASNGADGFGISKSSSFPAVFSLTQWKSDMIYGISLFFSVLPVNTWESLFDIFGQETDSKVQYAIILHLCKSFSGHSWDLLKVVDSIGNMMEKDTSCTHFLTLINYLLEKLVSGINGKGDNVMHLNQMVLDQKLQPVADLVNKIASFGLHDWPTRVKLIDCIYHFVVLDPDVGQAMIPMLLPMLQDADFRVRHFLARRIGVLFQTWDGHDELFQDICSHFGFKLVMASREKVVKAQEVLCSCPGLMLETAIITLAHIGLYSEKLEFEVIFMLCAIAAKDPSERQLVSAILDNVSGLLRYSSRTKYLEEIMGPILYHWVTCEVNIASLVELQELFVVTADANFFKTRCCLWLLPFLIICQDVEKLNLVAMIAGEPLPFLVRSHFVQIFSLCLALLCSNNPKKEAAELVLHSSLLHIAQISEDERDDLIKRRMVSIVGQLLSLSSSSSTPTLPFFTQETIALSLQIVVDGFLDMDIQPSRLILVDKLNIFRPDRVFKFLLELNYQITKAAHPRHRCHHLSAVEVLINVIGKRATAASTSYYIIHLVGQFVGNRALQDQCCGIFSTFLAAFETNKSKHVLSVLGKQLQFLVSKLVACYVPACNNVEDNVLPSSRVLDLLHQLTVDADPLLHDFVRDLEPFPDLDCFSRICAFQDEICGPYSSRDHLLKLVKRACHLSKNSLVWRKLILWNSVESDTIGAGSLLEFYSWDSDPELVSAVWSLAVMCDINEVQDIAGLVADFIAKVGIGDPNRVAFRLPGGFIQKPYGLFPENCASLKAVASSDIGISDEDLINLIRLVTKFLVDDCVTKVDVASRTLEGILSTERGQTALLHFDTYERSLIAVHSKGADHKLVEDLVKEYHENAEPGWNDSSIWTTHAKTYKMWICPLVHFLISYSNDLILQLCHEMVLLADELAEFLFPLLLYNLAGRNDLNVDICYLISGKVQECIFVEDNKLIKSIQLFLHSLNRLRSYYVTAKFKHGWASSSSRERSTLEKSKVATWTKVYWLSMDYLSVARAALHCGCFFTAVMYVEYWCEEHFGGLSLGSPNFSSLEMQEPHVELLIAAITQINEPDSIYGIIRTNRLTSQIITYAHEEKWSQALEYYDLLVRTSETRPDGSPGNAFSKYSDGEFSLSSSNEANKIEGWKSRRGLMRSLQQIGCSHVLGVYCQGLAGQKDDFQEDSEFSELQYEAAWRAGNWDFSLVPVETKPSYCSQHFKNIHFNENLHSCLRALQEGGRDEFFGKIESLKKELILLISNASYESTQYIHSTVVQIQILDDLNVAWDLRWPSYEDKKENHWHDSMKKLPMPAFPSIVQMKRLDEDWNSTLKQLQLNLNLLEPFIAFRTILLKILNCKEYRIEHLLQSASILRKGARYSLAVAALHEIKLLCCKEEKSETSFLSLARVEEAKLLWAQGQHELAISLAKYILSHYKLGGEAPNVHRLIGKWLAGSHSSNSRIVLEQHLKPSVELTEVHKTSNKKCLSRQCQTYFNLAHYTDVLFKSYEERLSSSEWQAALQLRKHKGKELDALTSRLKRSSKGEKTDYSVKIQELQKQLAMDKEEAERLQDDRDNFLNLALEKYQQCLVIGSKYDIRVVFRLVSLWFNLSSRQNVIKSMLNTVKEVQSYKFIPLVYQIASRLGSSKDGHGSLSFQAAITSLVKKMAVDHPFHTIYQLLALANGDRVRDKQRNRNSFVVDLDKKLAAENLLKELLSYHGAVMIQMNRMVEIYIKLAELETKKEDTNKRISLPRELRNVQQLELVPVVTATFPVDPSCKYNEGSFPHFKGLVNSIRVMNGINAPKVVECIDSDGNIHRQLAKSGNDDLRQDAVVPFTPSAGVLEWVNGTVPLGEYLLGSTRNGGAHGRYGTGDWSFLQCREHMATEKDKRKAFQKVCDNFRPVMHYFFLERFLQPADWFEKRLSYTRSVAASSMVGYIVGLGDRHSMNILIDEDSAEVVHIDLGVAFEQGLMLKTPERVPFRLTRDTIDGMGVTGVEGVFRRCCEETLSVMRENKEALLTIIEVFIHDPLYKWALSPLKALQRQKEAYDTDSSTEDSQDAYEGNKDAARALLRVKQKLDGYEDGEIRNVQGQVHQLIQDATDTERLCQMFPGWAAWL